jgi:phosphate:Na+ symporter
MDLWQLVAGLGLFQFGLKLLEEAIRELSGASFRRWLREATRRPFSGIVAGAVSTAVLQSSSVVTLMVLAFVGAGIIELRGAIAVVFGANLGTTMTGWIVATIGFKLGFDEIAFAFMGLGALGVVFLAEGSRRVEAARLLLGLGMMLFGLSLMKSGVDQLAQTFDLAPWVALGPLVMVATGLLLTAIIQSSSGAMMIALSAVHAGILGLPEAAAFVIGADLGTTVTAMLGALKGSADKRRVAAAHFLFNLQNSVVALSLRMPILALIAGPLAISDPLYALVAFHSTINLIGVLLYSPFIGAYARFLGNHFQQRDDQLARHIAATDPRVPEAALEAMAAELRQLIGRALELGRHTLGIANPSRGLGRLGAIGADAGGSTPQQAYRAIKQLEGEILRYAAKVQQQGLQPEQADRLHHLLHAVRASVTASKALMDIRDNWRQFGRDGHPALMALLGRLRAGQERFHADFDEIDPDTDPGQLAEALQLTYRRLREVANRFQRDLYIDAAEGQLDQLTLSTLLNVNRELRVSGKHLVEAARELLLTPEQNRFIEAQAGGA